MEEELNQRRGDLLARTAFVRDPSKRHLPESGQIDERFSEMEEKYRSGQGYIPAEKFVSFLENENREAEKLLDSGEDPLEVGMYCARFTHYIRANCLRNPETVTAIRNRWPQPPLVFNLASAYDQARTALIRNSGMGDGPKMIRSIIVKAALERPRIVLAVSEQDMIIDMLYFDDRPLTEADRNSIGYAVSAAFTLDGWIACESYTDDPKVMSCFGYWCSGWEVTLMPGDKLKHFLHPDQF